jgi:quinol monooxygenase YgiN
MAFIQIIEFRTDRVDEFDALLDQWLAQSKGWRTATRSTRTKDRDQPDTYVQIVEFPSYEKAQENSNHAETAEFAAALGQLCSVPPTFRNLDVTLVEDM